MLASRLADPGVTSMEIGLTRLCREFRCLEPAFAGGRQALAPCGSRARLPTVSLLAQDYEDNTNTAGSASARVSPGRKSNKIVYGHRDGAGLARGALDCGLRLLGDSVIGIVG